LSWVGLDTTDTFTRNHRDSNVTIFTPSCSPGVFDDVIFDILTVDIFGSVTNSGDGMIVNGSTIKRSNDTSGVGMEDWLIGLDGNVN